MPKFLSPILGVPNEISGLVNLDTIVLEGNYLQRSNTNATLALNYPEAYSGLLEVFGSGVVYQRYTVYLYGTGKTYVRSYSGSAWGGWITLLDNVNPIDTLSSIRAGTSLDMLGVFYQQGLAQPKIYRKDFATATTNATGQITFNHTCPFTPTAVFVTQRTSATHAGLPWGSSSLTATQVTFRWINGSAGGNLVSAASGSFTAFFVA